MVSRVNTGAAEERPPDPAVLDLSGRNDSYAQLALALASAKARIAKQQEEVEALAALLADREAAVADKEIRLEEALAWQAAETASIGYRVLDRLRGWIDRVAPRGTVRGNAAMLVGHAVDIVLEDGWWAMLRRAARVWHWLPRLWRMPLPIAVDPRSFRRLLEEGLSLDEQYQLWLAVRYGDREALSARIDELEYRPKVSLILYARDPDPQSLRELVDSVRAQIYERWELCLVFDSPGLAVRRTLRRYRRADRRIVQVRGTGGAVGARNEGLARSTGEFVAFLDPDSRLKHDALFHIVDLLDREPELNLVYTDEDHQDADGRLVQPFFKPGWSPDLLMGTDYVCRLGVFRRASVIAAGGLRSSVEGAEIYDLALRVTEGSAAVGHVPLPLHTTPLAKRNGTEESARRAVGEALARRGYGGRVEPLPGGMRARYDIVGDPKVSLIVPTRDRVDLLARCVSSVQERTTYPYHELVVVDNESQDPATLEYLSRFEGRIIRYPHEFNYARMMNVIAEDVDGDVLLFLNNDIEVITPEWIEAMLEHGQRPEVGVVGARLLYPDGSPQHEGVAVGVRGHAWNINHRGYQGLGEIVRNCAAVTGACMLTRAEVFRELGGFDERMRVAFNDVDYCLRARERGYLVTYTPHAVLFHVEGATRGAYHPDGDNRAFVGRWGDYPDPFYNPCFDRSRPFNLRPPR